MLKDSATLLIFTAAALFAGLLAVGHCSAQTATVPPTVEALQSELKIIQADSNYYRELAEKLKVENDDLRRRVEGLEAPLWAKYIQSKQREYDFQTDMMDVNLHNFQHQRIASYIILVLVVCVVLGGLWFAYVQLAAGLAPVAQMLPQAAQLGASNGPTPSLPGPAAPAVLNATTIDASLQKVTITSSVVGIIVLIISLAFLYIYTHEVYTIHVVDPYRPKVLDPDKQSPAGSSTSTQPEPQPTK
jgi:hypothetical protein